MLIEEATWFGKKIASVDASDIFPMLNVGSSTEKYRKIDQPWVDENIFKPARKKNQKVIHMDVKPDQGIDIVGDLTDPAFLKRVSNMKTNSIFCSNVLELLPNRKEVCHTLTSIIPDSWYIFVACPYRFPFYVDHSRDTMFRPDIEELCAMFPNTRLVHGEIIKGGTYYDFLERNPFRLIMEIIRVLVFFYKPKKWRASASQLLWLFRNYEITCIVLRKLPNGRAEAEEADDPVTEIGCAEAIINGDIENV